MFICAIAGSLLFLQVCFWIEKLIPKVVHPFAFLGRYTLYMVCVHGFAQFTFRYWFNFTTNTYLNNLIHFGIGTGLFFIILGIDLLIHFVIKKSKEKNTPPSEAVA